MLHSARLPYPSQNQVTSKTTQIEIQRWRHRKNCTPAFLSASAMATVALQSPPSILCSRRSFSCFRPPSARQHLSNRVRSSAEAGSDTVVEKDPDSPPSEESPVGTQKRPSSLISAANVQKAVRGLGLYSQNLCIRV